MRNHLFSATIVAITLAIGAAQTFASFNDVPSSHPYNDSIIYMQEQGIVEGYSDGTYKPDNKINRAEFTKIVIGAYYSPDEYENCFQGLIKFTDTPDDWYLPYICQAIGDEIIQGYSDNTFRPGNNINYAEAAKIISIAESLFTGETFPASDPWYEPYTQNLEKKNSKPGSIKSMDQFITRGEMAFIIHQLDEQIASSINEGSHAGSGNSDNTAFNEEFTMEPEDCFPEEKYDPIEKVCYYECSTDAECEAIEKKIMAQAEAIGQDYYDGDKTYEPADIGTHGGTPQPADPEQQAEATITTYTINGDKIENPQKAQLTDNSLQTHQEDTTKHQEIWKRFTTLIPADNRNMLSHFEIFTDGKEGTLAAVAQSDTDPTKWVLYVDIVDAYPEGKLDQTDLTYSLIHEFGHVLTLNAGQVTADQELFNSMNLSDDEFNNLVAKKEASCTPKFFLQEGCSTENSYINKFFQNYWKDIYQELLALDQIQDEEAYYTAAENFYEKYKARFVTDYASTNPGEDIAESWTAFILKEKPTGNTIADQKVKFFYEFPELVKLRQVIRTRL